LFAESAGHIHPLNPAQMSKVQQSHTSLRYRRPRPLCRLPSPVVSLTDPVDIKCCFWHCFSKLCAVGAGGSARRVGRRRWWFLLR